MTDEMAISYQAAVRGTPVLSSAGTQIGTLEHVLEVPEVAEPGMSTATGIATGVVTEVGKAVTGTVAVSVTELEKLVKSEI